MESTSSRLALPSTMLFCVFPWIQLTVSALANSPLHVYRWFCDADRAPRALFFSSALYKASTRAHSPPRVSSTKRPCNFECSYLGFWPCSFWQPCSGFPPYSSLVLRSPRPRPHSCPIPAIANSLSTDSVVRYCL